MIEAAGALIEQDDIDMVADALRNMNGPDKYYYVEQFEKEFAEYHGRKHALMTPNCTTAIHLLLAGLGIGRDHDVVVPECTWIGSSAGIKWLGANTLFCDIDRRNWCIDPDSLDERLKSKDIRAVIAVNLYGNMCAWNTLEYLADRYNVPIIEDTAESIGSTYGGRKSGSFGVGSVFSFHRTKTMTTGEGGMLLVDDDTIFENCRMLRDHGRTPTSKPYMNEVVGYKYMPFNMQAALGLSQFRKLDKLVEIKRNHLRRYKELLKDVKGLQFNDEPPYVYNSAWITAVVLPEELGLTKHDVIERMAKKNIPIRPFFYPLSSLKAYDPSGQWQSLSAFKRPVAYDVSERGINLPGAMDVTDDQMVEVAEALKEILR